MTLSTNIPPSIDWERKLNRSKAGKTVWNLSAYVTAAVIGLTAQGCATKMPQYNACLDTRYTTRLADDFGRNQEALAIAKSALANMRNQDRKNQDSTNASKRIVLNGEIKQLEQIIENMHKTLRQCNQDQSRIRSY